MIFIVSIVGQWVLKALMGLGASEATAGRVVASRVFGPVVLFLAAGAAVFAAWHAVPAIIRLHDARIAGAAKRECVASLELQLERTRREALETAVARAQETIRARNLDLDQSKAREEQLQKERDDALAATTNPDLVVVPADDPWLQRYRPQSSGRPR